MSKKLHKLTDRMGDLTARRVELRFRIADATAKQAAGDSVMDWANEIAQISESIGELKMAIGDEQGRIAADLLDSSRAPALEQVPA